MSDVGKALLLAETLWVQVQSLSLRGFPYEPDNGFEALGAVARILSDSFPEDWDNSLESKLSYLWRARKLVGTSFNVGEGSKTWDIAYRIPMELRSQLPEASSQVRSIGEGVEWVERYLSLASSAVLRSRPSDTTLKTADIPEPKLAPYKFGVAGDRLIILHQESDAGANAIVASAERDNLVERAEALLSHLEPSNSPHVLAEFAAVVRLLNGELNPVKLGLQNLSYVAVVNASADELSEALSARLTAFGMAVGLFVAQFEEWRLFSETAASVELPAATVKAMAEMAKAISAHLEGREDLADPEVPAALRHVVKAVERAPNDGRAKLSIVRTLENLLIRATVAVRDQMIYGVAEDLLTTGREVAVVAVIHVALTYVSPVLGTPGLEWLGPVVALLQSKTGTGSKS